MNNQPTDREMLLQNLQEQTMALRERRNELMNAARKLPEVIDDAAWARRVADFIKQITMMIGTAGEVELARKHAKAPHLEAGRIVDSYFRDEFAALEKLKAILLHRETDYLCDLELDEPLRGEFGSILSLRKSWAFKIIAGRDGLDWKQLCYWVDQECIEKAIRSFIADGGRAMRGVEIFEQEKASVR